MQTLQPCVLQGATSDFASGRQSEPPLRGATVITLLLRFEPPPQVLVQPPQRSQSPHRQLTASHSVSWQDFDSERAALQPLLSPTCSTSRCRVDTPVPHADEQSDHADQRESLHVSSQHVWLPQGFVSLRMLPRLAAFRVQLLGSTLLCRTFWPAQVPLQSPHSSHEEKRQASGSAGSGCGQASVWLRTWLHLGPPKLEGVRIARLRNFCQPSPRTHFDHAVHSLTSQAVGVPQGFWLHGKVSRVTSPSPKSPSVPQDLPPHAACPTTRRIRAFQPVPHVLLHWVHSAQVDIRQSTASENAHGLVSFHVPAQGWPMPCCRTSIRRVRKLWPFMHAVHSSRHSVHSDHVAQEQSASCLWHSIG
mmetsp:Transcript_42916/g.113639  ORF Transcript_42916/g.113639 Transcript_42916/m.113639 type:complete len:362 (-) Transcript_42916:32-1117(-)